MRKGDFFEPNNYPSEIQNRWIVNCMRHKYTNYEKEILLKTKGKVGREIAIKNSKREILFAIAEKYPSLIEECVIQIRETIKTNEE